MTLVSSDRWGTLCFFGIVCGHFFCPVACLGSLIGGDIRIKARWDLVRVPSKLERLESVDSGQLVEVLTRVSLLIQWLTLVFRVGFSYFQGRFLLTDLFYPWELRHAWHESRRCVFPGWSFHHRSLCSWGKVCHKGLGGVFCVSGSGPVYRLEYLLLVQLPFIPGLTPVVLLCQVTLQPSLVFSSPSFPLHG